MSQTEVKTYEDLRAALQARRKQLGMTTLELDYVSGLHTGYSGKILCGMKTLGPVSLPLMLGALKLRLILIPEELEVAA